jgi:hypothetical protein
MAVTEESMENVGSPFSGEDFLDSDSPPPEYILAMMQKLMGLTDVDRKELTRKLLQEFLKIQEPVGPVRQLLSSQLFVLLIFLSVIAAVFGKKFAQVSGIKSVNSS